MALAVPDIKVFADMLVWECFTEDMELKYTVFGYLSPADDFFFGLIPRKKLDIKLSEYSAALEHIPDANIYPRIPEGAVFTEASPDMIGDDYFIKRPKYDDYHVWRDEGRFNVLYDRLLIEAQNLERLFDKVPAHPGLIRYHGCRMFRGYVTGVVLDNHVDDVTWYIELQMKPELDKKQFLDKLTAAVDHLHAYGFAHNDIQPHNIMVDKEGNPVLIDFESAYPVGERLHVRGTPGWIKDDDFDNYTHSKIENDEFALEKMRVWLDEKLPSKDETLPCNEEQLPINEERQPSNDENLPCNEERLPINDGILPITDGMLPGNSDMGRMVVV